MASEARDPNMNKIEFDSDSPSLVIEGGLNSGAVFPLSTGMVTLGRQADNDVVIDEPIASRKHAVIIETDGSYYIRDLGSTNGTYVNRQMIGDEQYVLNHGDVIHLGGTNILVTFQHSGARTMKVAIGDLPSSPVMVDARARHVYVGGRLLEPPMARKEFDLLALLDSRRGEAISRDDIAAVVWPERPDGDVGSHEIEQCVHRVRARIEEDTSNPQYLVTVRGYGYKLS